ncbi:MAG: hypothetical protein WAM26_18445, partial [Nitrososphaeraceae archaeon]
MDEFKSILCRLYLLSALALAFCSGAFLAGPGNQLSALALTLDGSFYLSYYDNPAPKQIRVALDDPGTGEIFPLSSSGSSSYDYSGSRGISVQQNVTQHNICSSNTAYCY